MNTLIRMIKNVAIEANKKIGEIEWFVFGSIISGEPMPCDIDILAVYPNQLDPSPIRQLFALHAKGIPVDLLIASKSECKELNLIVKQNAIPLFDLQLDKAVQLPCTQTF